MTRYKIKKDFDMNNLQKFGYEYVGSYYRGDNWMKVVNGIDELEPRNGIIIHGDWDKRRCYFRFPYRKTTDSLDILLFISDLVEAGLVEREED